MNNVANPSPKSKLARKLVDVLRDYTEFCEEHVTRTSPSWEESLKKFYAIEDLTVDVLAEDLAVQSDVARAIARTRPSMGRHSRSRYDKLQSAILNHTNKISNYFIYGVTVDILSDWEVEDVRKGNVQYGSTENVTMKRSAVCRSCAQRIQKGEEAINFYWDFMGCGSWTAGSCFIHKASCKGAEKREFHEIGEYRCAVGHEFTKETTERSTECPKCKCAAALQNVKSVQL